MSLGLRFESSPTIKLNRDLEYYSLSYETLAKNHYK